MDEDPPRWASGNSSCWGDHGLRGYQHGKEQPKALTWMGLVPAATIFMPSAMMAALRMVAVVVPSPAVSLVFEAACAHARCLQPSMPHS